MGGNVVPKAIIRLFAVLAFALFACAACFVPVAFSDSGDASFAAMGNDAGLKAESSKVAAVSADVEPNDKRERAQAIQLGKMYSGRLSYYDDEVDWYKVKMPNSGLLSLESSQSVELYSASGEKLDDHFYSGASCRLTGGTYYVCLRYSYYDNAYNPRYTFKLTFESAKESFKETDGGSNNSRAKASKVSLNKRYRAQIAINDSTDYYRLTLPASGRVTFSATSYFNARFACFDANGTQLWASDFGPDSNSTRKSASWSHDLGQGVYFVRVVAAYPDYQGGVYTFKATLKNAKESFAEKQGGSNNLFSSANKIKFDKTYVSQLAKNDAKDIFKFKTTDSGIVRVKASSTLSSMQLRLSDSYGDPLASNIVTRKNYSWSYDCGKGTRYLTLQRGDSGSQTTGPVRFSVFELKDIARAKVGPIPAQTYSGAALKPTFKVKLGAKVLKLGRDYKVSFSNNVDAGTATVTLEGKGNYAGKKRAAFIINRADIGKASISDVKSQTYTGDELETTFTLKYGGKRMSSYSDYTVDYSRNVNAGKAKMTIHGEGNFKGKKIASFIIDRANISGAHVFGVETATYTGKKLEPRFSLSFHGELLGRGSDYAVKYSNNRNAGIGRMTIKGKGNFKGSKPATFTIKPTDISKARFSNVKSATYTGNELNTAFDVKMGGKKLRSGIDYLASFSNNVNVGKGRITIKGFGNYSGKKTTSFTIKKAAQKVRIKGRSWSANSRYTYYRYDSVSVDRSYSCTVVESHGELTFKKVRADKWSGYFKVKRNGTVVVKPGTPEGKYKLVIRAKAAGDRNYKPGATTFTTTIKVKFW